MADSKDIDLTPRTTSPTIESLLKRRQRQQEILKDLRLSDNKELHGLYLMLELSGGRL